MAVMPGTEGQIDQQKAALLSVIAQQGSQGQVAFNAEAERRKQQQMAAQGAIAARSGEGTNAPQALTTQLQAQQNALGSIYSQDAAMSNQTFNNSIALTNSANDAYMQQARAAVPIVRSQTEGTIAQIRAEQQEAQAQREYEAEQRAYEAQQRILEAGYAEEDRAFEREQMDFEREQMTEDRSGEAGEKFMEEIAKKQDQVVNDSLRTDPGNDYDVFSTAVGNADNVADALSYANRLIEEMAAADVENGGSGKVIDKNSRNRIAKRIYKYFTLKNAPDDVDELNDALADENAAYDSIDPTYTPAAERRSEAGRRAASASAADDRAKRKKKAVDDLALRGLGAMRNVARRTPDTPADEPWWKRGRVLTGGS